MSSIADLPILSIEHAAMMEVAKSLWLSRIAHDDPAALNNLFRPFEITIPLPNIMKIRLNVYLDTLGKEIDNWLIHHVGRIFPNREIDYLVPCLLKLVWRIDGTIDYYSTAKELVRMEYLTKKEKFEIARSYFLLGYVREKWPQLTEYMIMHVHKYLPRNQNPSNFSWARIWSKFPSEN